MAMAFQIEAEILSAMFEVFGFFRNLLDALDTWHENTNNSAGHDTSDIPDISH
jgi:hypothetical protein